MTEAPLLQIDFIKFGLFILRHPKGTRTELSFESMTSWLDWHVNFFGHEFTVWFEKY